MTAADAPQQSRDTQPAFRYNDRLANTIEVRWQAEWERRGDFVQPNPGGPGFDATRPKFYCLDMFPYPSGAGLHVGHPEGYTASDIVCRYMRMKGYNVLHPMGWDAFGLPAEQYAIETNVHPAITTRRAIDTFRRQLKRFGFSYDWTRDVATIDPGYYRWTQWIFLKCYGAWCDRSEGRYGLGRVRPISELFDELESGRFVPTADCGVAPAARAPAPACAWRDLTPLQRRAVIDAQRLAYLDETTVNWCPALGTVLANDEVIDGRSERGNHPVLRRPLRQWMFRITALAERLLRDLDLLEWPESTKTIQREWIGRSEGAEIDFPLLMTTPADEEHRLRVFTTRPDTIFGATYMVVAPEHPLVDAVLRGPAGWRAADAPEGGFDPAALRTYVEAARNRSEVDRQTDAKEKTGCFTGVHARNPATGERIPVWTADYVLAGYGHGAIMAVPAHDQRDFEFAARFGLPIRDVVYPRPVAAMAYYARHAAPVEIETDQWASTLADLVALVTSESLQPAEFPRALALVRTRREAGERRPDGQVSEALLAAASNADLSELSDAGLTGHGRARRGGIQLTWLDALRELGLDSFDDLQRRFADKAYFARAGAAFPGTGYGVNSANPQVALDGLDTREAKTTAAAWLERGGVGRRRVNYRLRDWTFARQRYWGEPFPIVYDDQGRHYAVGEAALPVLLPELEDFSPYTGDEPRALLAKAKEWVNTTAGAAGVDPADLPPGTPVRRETNTMPGSAGSSWYFLRYMDAANADRFVGRAAERYWSLSPRPSVPAPGAGIADTAPAGPGDDGPHGTFRPDLNALGAVDLYIGGSEHAVGHLLYARFWHKVLFDLGEVSTPEPFQRLFHQGMITAYAYQRPNKTLVPNDRVSEPREGEFIETATGEKLTPVVAKMSKSLKNVVNPDDIIRDFGADTFRLYEMYMGPLEASKPWNTRDIIGLHRFLQRAWRLCVDEQTGELKLAGSGRPEIERALHKTIVKVEGDIPRLALNTAIAALIEFVNAALSAGGGSGAGGGGDGASGGAGGGGGALTREQMSVFVRLLSPFVPHVAEELWIRLGHTGALAHAAFPAADQALAVDDQVEIPVQVAGKVRAKVQVAAWADRETLERAVLADAKVQALIAGKAVKKVIAVPGKLVNLVLD